MAAATSTSESPQSVPEAAPTRRFGNLIPLPSDRDEAFAFALGWTTLIHLLAAQGERSIWLLPIATGAVILLLRPANVWAMTVLLAAILGRTISQVDAPDGLWVLLSVLAVSWFFSIIGAFWRYGGWPHMDDMGVLTAPIFRGAFVIGWLVILVHQVNDAFLDVATSCAVAIYERGSDVIPFLPALSNEPWSRWPIVVLVVETVIVLGLWLPWARRVPVLVAALFLTVVGAAEPTLAVTGFAFLVLFAFRPIADRALARLRRIGRRLPVVADVVTVLIVVVAALAVVRALAAATGSDLLVAGDLALGPPVARFLTVVTGATLVVLYAVAMMGRDSLTEPEPPLEWFGPGAALTATAVAALGLLPYLGLGTAHSLTDASNLRTEGTRWNHLVLPRDLALFETQEPLIQVLDPRHPVVEGVSRDLGVPASRVLLTEHEIRRRVVDACSQGPVSPLTVAQDGELSVVDDPCQDQILGAPESLFLDRLVAHRPIPVTDRCLT